MPEGWRCLIDDMGQREIPILNQLGTDAESLIEKIDAFSHNCPSKFRDVIQATFPDFKYRELDLQVANVSEFFQRLSILVRKSVCAECEGPLDELDEDSDRWKPYDRWFKRLSTSGDIVLSFNYDSVFQRLRVRNKNAGTEKFWQLHGSATEILSNDNLVEQNGAYKRIDSMPSICLPGRMKSSVDTTGPLSERWTWANHQLSECRKLSIVGYSMPPTDNLARMTILDSIAKNKNLTQVNLVLGPSFGTVTSTRIEQIIKAVASKSVIIQNLPFYAQDFLPFVKQIT